MLRVLIYLYFAVIAIAALAPFHVAAKGLTFEDAEIFSQILARNPDDLASSLKKNYLDRESQGLAIFKRQIRDEEYLASVVASNLALYKRAAAVCLPEVKKIESSVNKTLLTMSEYLGDKEIIPVSIIFGANNTGATVSPQGIALALEVICQEAQTPQDLERLVSDYVAHEVVHVFQFRHSTRNDLNFTLLEMSLIEGSADFLAERGTSQSSKSAAERRQYGLQHEHRLWQEFKPGRDSHRFQPWLYTPEPENGAPRDMGYWVGQRIAESFYNNAEDKQAAVQTLLKFTDAEKILTQSGYNP